MIASGAWSANRALRSSSSIGGPPESGSFVRSLYARLESFASPGPRSAPQCGLLLFEFLFQQFKGIALRFFERYPGAFCGSLERNFSDAVRAHRCHRIVAATFVTHCVTPFPVLGVSRAT